jgi:hypothetical protein
VTTVEPEEFLNFSSEFWLLRAIDDRDSPGHNRGVMRQVHWLFLIGAVLFISGIGFVIAGARTAQSSRDVRSAAAAPVTSPVASVKQIMQGIVGPAAAVVYGAVGTVETLSGVEETAPKNDQEWESVANSAAALVESGNLLLLGSRVVDTGDWVKMSRAQIDAAIVALKAAEAKDAAGIFASGEAINVSCDNCHEKYQRH